jgi:hypothetical protein
MSSEESEEICYNLQVEVDSLKVLPTRARVNHTRATATPFMMLPSELRLVTGLLSPFSRGSVFKIDFPGCSRLNQVRLLNFDLYTYRFIVNL